MPGIVQNGPSRPYRLWTFSNDKLVLSTSVMSWVVFPFGVLFSATGILMVIVILQTGLGIIGLAAPPPGVVAQPIWQTLLGGALVLIIAASHLGFGVVLLLCLSTTFDRARGTVTVRSGWMGLRRQSLPLSTFQRVCILPSTHFFSWIGRQSGKSSYFDIVLLATNKSPLVVGIVTQSRDLAHQVVNEICGFTTLADGSNELPL